MNLKRRNIDSELREKIDLYVDGGLDNEQVDELWAELVHDRRALNYFKSIVDIGEIDDEKYEERAKAATQKRTKIYWRLIAVLVLIAGAFFIFHISRETTEPVQPITSIALNYYRSADGVLDNEPMLRKAIKLDIHGNVDMAVRTIDVAMSRTDDIRKNSMLLIQSGGILYNAGRYREALYRFERVSETSGIGLLIREKAYWYLGNAYFQLGELEAAKAAFQNTYKLDGAYRRVAKEYLTALTQVIHE